MADKLFCPRCGNRFVADISYCRTCGLSLDGVSEIVNGEAASASEVRTRPNFKLFRLGIGLFILGLVVGLINGALRDFELYPNSFGKTLFLAIIAVGMLLLGAGFVFPTKRYAKRKPGGTAGSKARLDTAPLAGQLSTPANDIDFLEFPNDHRDLDAVPVGSVTEQTTRNLEQ